MKVRNLLAVVVLGASSVALAQGPTGWAAGTTTTSVDCSGATAGVPAAGTMAPCSTDGQTLLVATFQEGLTLTVPNQINFALVPGFMAPGSQPLTATVKWTLDKSYTDIWVDAFFKDATNTMTASNPETSAGAGDNMGGNIGADAIEAVQNGVGGMSPFNNSLLNLTDPLYSEGDSAAAFPMDHILLSGATTTIGTFTGFVGQASPYLNLYINFLQGGPLYPTAGPTINPTGTGTWSGFVYVRAQAY